MKKESATSFTIHDRCHGIVASRDDIASAWPHKPCRDSDCIRRPSCNSCANLAPKCPHCGSMLLATDTIPSVPFAEAISLLAIKDRKIQKMFVKALESDSVMRK